MKRPARWIALVLLASGLLLAGAACPAGAAPSGSAASAPAQASFILAADIAIRSAPRALAVADFNRDGRPDLAVLNSGGTVTTLLGLGGGSFGARHIVAVPRSANTLAVADVNGGGKPDLIVGASASGKPASVSVLLGRGDGTFRRARSYFLGLTGLTGWITPTFGDLNGDARPDIVTAYNDRVAVLINRGAGIFRAAKACRVPAQDFIRSLALARLDGDHPPCAVTGSDGGGNTRFGAISVLVGKGDGGFKAPRTRQTGLLVPAFIVLADVNGDHRRDLLVANHAGSEDIVTDGRYEVVDVALGKGDGTFTAPVGYSFAVGDPMAITAFHTADFNGDHDLDLLVASTFGMNLLYGSGDGTFSVPDVFDTARRVGGALVAVADFNGDGRPDLAVAAATGRNVTIFLNSTGAGV